MEHENWLYALITGIIPIISKLIPIFDSESVRREIRAVQKAFVLSIQTCEIWKIYVGIETSDDLALIWIVS